ncbi:hypothetical protein K432DRAFT_306547 [Lepidopterella palustris CBS 459.81]|uniref:Nucleoporin NUP37 n=1 Tax=Lepidopterella palustris CBS 459.81 TaxID=1314670 RepID=A0A8E2E304_9PEZI|nr:hypothetical protein K432DRAFT_306547 [Lepidopterella palustris CBS 459.81]
MKPLVSSKGKATQLSYELPHRIHEAKIYPVKAPNGSTIILYGHEHGVRILWRDGRPPTKNARTREQPTPPPVNGTGNESIMIIDSDDEEPRSRKIIHYLPDEAEFESEEEELDPEQPFPSFIQQIDLPLNTEALHIAIPQIPPITSIRPAESMPPVFNKKIVFAVACVDFSVRIITLPLNPPSAVTKTKPLEKHRTRWGEEIIEIKGQAGHQSIPNGVAMTWTSKIPVTSDDESEDGMPDDDDDEPTPRRNRSSLTKGSRSRSGNRNDINGWDLLVASHSAELSGLLRVWRFPIENDRFKNSIYAPNPILPLRTQYLTSPTSHIAFSPAHHPKRRHSQLLVVDPKGIVRIYDPFASPRTRPRSGRIDESTSETGAWLSSFSTSFEAPKHYATSVPALAHRKRILDASWASDGRSIIALLTDGEWGIWDVDQSGPNPPTNPTSFAIRGFIGTATSSNNSSASSGSKPRGSRSTLAPMTPNTRRTKEESLFHGSASGQSNVPRGGISIATLHSISGGAPEDSVILWYGQESYRIPNLGQFWARSASGSGGSLYGPGLSRIQGLNLHGEALNSIEQFGTTTAAARMAVPRDLLVVAEHSLIVLTTTTVQLGRDLSDSLLFGREREEEEQTRRADQTLLASGELDIGGMDRLLDSMEATQGGTIGFGNPRKVLFDTS